MKVTETEVILTPEEWEAASRCGHCGKQLGNPCSAAMHQDDCAPASGAMSATPRCPYCSFDPTSLNDYCAEHRPASATPREALVALVEKLQHQAQAASLASNTLYRTGAYADASYERGKADARRLCIEELNALLASDASPQPPGYRLCENCGRALIGSWPSDDLRRAFVAGAKWWEYQSQGATMWASDQDKAEAEAEKRYASPQPPSPPSKEPTK